MPVAPTTADLDAAVQAAFWVIFWNKGEVESRLTRIWTNG
jgi:hypothetical protein